jgi:hypothetical protein
VSRDAAAIQRLLMNANLPLGTAGSAVLKLLAYCRAHDWAGNDPYDALNSRIFTALPLLNSRIPRLVATQALKRSPVDLRPLMRIPPTQNPKAMALFLAAALKLKRIAPAHAEGLPELMRERLIALRSQGTPYWCWGYSFPWQTRTLVVPRGAPNLVCTTFVAGALLDAYEERGEPRDLEMALSAADYLLNDLYRADDRTAGFSYPLPSMKAHIHNANLLAAALLCRLHRLTGLERLLDPALKVARHAVSCQRNDGSWPYGEGDTQQWVDNFHTGYNLGALRDISRDIATTEFDQPIRLGLDYYLGHFLRQDGAARYFHDRTYPIDIHCVAQTIITLVTFDDMHPGTRQLADAALEWAMDHMWDERGFFYYRVLRFGTIRTSYMRWSQAWMLLALATLLEAPVAVRQPRPRTAVLV